MCREHHKLKVAYEQGKLVASCECGQWACERFLLPGERPSQVMRSLEEEFEKHLAEGPPD